MSLGYFPSIAITRGRTSPQVVADFEPGDISDCPARPQSESPSELGFVRRPMVRWLDPRQLISTGARLLLSYIFGSYADKREFQASIPATVVDRSGGCDLWLDYVADLGDGWDSTYTIARLIAAEELKVTGHPKPHRLSRGKLLIMGGDQVYPGSSRAEYVNRMIGPYRAALPCTPSDNHPELFAIPGSHDWHDGLTSFMRIFCQQRWIGGWRTHQRRSYFAIKLPHNWWLWGIDIQFDSYIDDRQLGYFADVVRSSVLSGDRIILCTAKTPWLRAARENSGAYSARNLDYFERRVLRHSGAQVALYISSGRHHYCRYAPEDGGAQRVTAGGGGAFCHPTHELPENLDLLIQGNRTSYRRVAAFPSSRDSKRLRKKLWLLPFRNASLALVLGGLDVVLALMLGLHLTTSWSSVDLAQLTIGPLRNPAILVMVLVMIGLQWGALIAFAHEAKGLRRLLMGTGHAIGQLSVMAAAMLISSRIASFAGSNAAAALSFLTSLWLLGGFGAVLGLALYLWCCNIAGFHANEAYGALGVADFKHFLRLHIDAGGNLTLYAIGVNKVPRRWRLRPHGGLDSPWFDPGGPRDSPHLVEPPVRISK